jgi:prolyl-tRNA synthetase
MTDTTRILRRDETVIDTSKGSSRRAKSKSTKLLERSGYISDFGSGLYGLTHLGQETRRRVEQVVRSEHVQNGCVEVSVPSLQYADDWKASGRWETFEGEMFTFTNRNDSDMCLAPTHEEGIVRMFRNSIRSYNQLPLTVFQIKEKHREDKARQGLLRAKEFVMKDAYSLHQNAESMHRR